MSDPYGPVHRALLTLVVSRDDLDEVERALDVLGANAPLETAPDREREAIHALRDEVRTQVAAVRAAEPGAVKRLHGLLHLLIEAELRHVACQQRTPEVD